MFKRIIKILGLVVLGFVVVIGGTIGFMAIRGDFKKQVIKPTAIDFSVEVSDLKFDVKQLGSQTIANEQICSFTILSKPDNVTELECTLKLNNPTLITFVKWNRTKGVWEDYNSNKFYLNEPIYFRLNDVTEKNEKDYYDGILEITVKDASGLLQDTLKLEIDRIVTSISFVDRGVGKEENNKITNGLFGYEEQGKYGEAIQMLEAVEGEDYPLEIITAPLKAGKPFASKNAKITEIYYIKNNQPQMVVYDAENKKVVLHDPSGNEGIVKRDCDFIKFDEENNRFVFNSATSGKYEFKLATYPTYDVEDEMAYDQTLSFVQRLLSGEMITKTVVMTVNGTDAESIDFEGDIVNIGMNLLKNNSLIVNNATVIDKHNLGLVLSKANSGTEITGRYNELKFLEDESFTTDITWEFKVAQTEFDNTNEQGFKISKDSLGNIKYKEMPATIRLYAEGGKRKAVVSNLFDNSTLEFDVGLEITSGSGTLILTNNDEPNDLRTQISISLNLDEKTKKLLTLAKEYQFDGLTKIRIAKTSLTNLTNASTEEYYVDNEGCAGLILGKQISGTDNYEFKALRANSAEYSGGLYLVLLGKKGTGYEGINHLFETSIEHDDEDGSNTIVNIKPISGDLDNYDGIELYAIVVNANGSCYYTTTPRTVVVNKIDTQLTLSNDGVLDLPIVVGSDALEYNIGDGVDVEDWVGQKVNDNGSYSEILLFAPMYSLLTSATAPKEWGNGLEVYSYNSDSKVFELVKPTDYLPNTYYTKNNYQFIYSISTTITNEAGIELTAYLVGYINEQSGGFVNAIQPTGVNYYSKLYPAVIKTKYLTETGKLQSATSYINELIKNQTIELTDNNGAQLIVDVTLANAKNITRKSNKFVKASGNFNDKKTYYNSNFEAVVVPPANIADWANKAGDYYENVDCISVIDLGLTAPTLNNLPSYTCYTLEDNILTKVIWDSSSASNWEDYYVIISHFVIKSSNIQDAINNNEATFDIVAYPVSAGITIQKEYKFIVNVDEYFNYLEGENKIEVDIAQISEEIYLTATSYFQFDESDSLLSVLGGDALNVIDENNYQIIPGHSNIVVDWTKETIKDVESDEERQYAITSLFIEHSQIEEMLQSILSNLDLSVIKYNASGDEIGELSKTEYEDYIKINETYGHTEEAIKGTLIYTTFNVEDELLGCSYIKFRWNYVTPYGLYSVDSPMLEILSRELTGYTIDVDAYKYKDDAIYDGDVKYELEVGYDTDYTFKVYALDNDGNRLCADAPGTNPKFATQEVAFGWDRNGGWIKPDPFYANIADIKISSSDTSVEFNDDNTQITFAQSTESDTITITARDTSSDKTCNIQLKVNVDRFKFDDESVEETTSDDNIALSGLYKYGEDDITNKLNLSIKDGFTITSAGGVVTSQYKIGEYNGYPAIVDDSGNPLITISLDGETWNVERRELYSIDLTVIAKTVLGSKEIELKFTSPYSTDPNLSNTTKVIYGGTQFVLATNYESEALWKFALDGSSKIIVKYNGNELITKPETIGSGSAWIMTVPSVDKLTDAEFELWYKQTDSDPGYYIGSISLAIAPNIKFNENVGTIDLNDFDNTEYNFTDLKIYKYKTDATLLYYHYNYTYNATDENRIQYLDSGLGYNCETFIDEELTEKYTTNVVNVKDNKLSVNNPISEVGTYYVQVTIASTIDEINVEVGKLLFRVSAKSNVVNADNNDVDPIEITAKTNSTIELTDGNAVDLQEIFNLSRNNESYHPVYVVADTFEDGKTYYTYNNNTEKYENKLFVDEADFNSDKSTKYVRGVKFKDNYIYKIDASGKYVKASNDDYNNGTPCYYKAGLLTDILWVDTKDANLQVVYKYDDDKVLTQKADKLTYGGTVYTFIGTSYNNEYVYNEVQNSNSITWDGKTIYYYQNYKYIPTTSKIDGVSEYYTLTSNGEGYAYTKVTSAIGWINNTTTYYYKQLDGYLPTNVSVVGVSNYYTRGGGFDIKTMKIVDVNGQLLDGKDETIQLGNNIYYYSGNATNKGVIYCAQNAYLFEKQNNDGTITIIALSAESAGKTIYTFTIDNGFISVKDEDASTPDKIDGVVLDDLISLELYYDSFGGLSDTYTASVDFSAELIFTDIDDKKFNIKTNDVYTINVLPYIVEPTNKDILNDTNYILYNDNNAITVAGAIFNKPLTNVKKLTFGDSVDNSYEITTVGDRQTIKFYPKGNEYTTYIPVTITYDDEANSIYSYNAEITVKNKVVVNISYPYNVDKSNDAYEVFNATNQLSKSLLDGNGNALFNPDDFAKYADEDGRFKYDIALKGDTIDLKSRYSTQYRQDDTATDKSIGKIQLVAVSATYADSIKNVVDSLILNSETGIIQISTSLNYTGYILFKVYAQGTGQANVEDTGAYGYYLLKVVDDAQFEYVLMSSGRNMVTIAKSVPSDGKSIISQNDSGAFITKTDIISSSNYINADLINDNLSNVYLFLLENKDNIKFNEDNNEIDVGSLIHHNTKVNSTNTIQTITVAVIVESGTSLVNVCNFELILQPDVDVGAAHFGSGTSTDPYYDMVMAKDQSDEDRYIYQLITNYTYDFANDGNNTKDVGSYFAVQSTEGGSYSLSSVVFVNDVYGRKNSDNIDSFTSETASLIKISGTEIAKIADKKLVLLKALKDETHFYLKLTYTKDVGIETVDVYLRIDINPYEFNSLTETTITPNAEIGETDAKFNVSTLVGDYKGSYDYTLTSDGVTNEGTSSYVNPISISSGLSAKVYDLTIVLTDIVPAATSKPIKITVNPAIKPTYNTEEIGKFQDESKLAELTKTNYANNIELVGSSLNVTTSTSQINISNKTGVGATTYLTINVGAYSLVNFSLTSWDETDLADYYFVTGDEGNYNVAKDVTLAKTTEQKPNSLNFVHSANDLKLRLNVTVYNYPNNNYYDLTFTEVTTDYIKNTYYDASGKLLTDETYSGKYYMIEGGSSATDKPFKPNTYYCKDGDDYKLITEDYAYASTYALYIKLPKTYSLSSAYRVDDATFETVVDTATLGLGVTNDTSRQTADKHFLGTDDHGIGDNAIDKVHGSRIAITLVDSETPRYGYTNLAGLGLLTDNNPNKLLFSVDGQALGTDLVFDIANRRPTLTMTSTTLSADKIEANRELVYKFEVFTAETDYSVVTQNANLVVNVNNNSTPDNPSDDTKTILVTHDQLNENIDSDEAFMLAYMQYLPSSIDGMVAYVDISVKDSSKNVVDTVTFNKDKFVQYQSNKSVIKLSATGLDKNEIYTITVNVITMNGLAETFTLVVANLNIDYGYGETYETAFAGGEIGKLNDNLRDRENGAQRVTVKLNTDVDVDIEYLGSFNGHNISAWDGVSYNYTGTSGLIYYNDGVIRARSVATDTSVTMVFNVKDGNNVIGRIYYKILLKNNLEIELNPDIGYGAVVDLYLGSKAYTDDGDTTKINLTQEKNGVYYNNLYIKLYRLSYQNGVRVRTDMGISSSDVANYLEFSIDHKDQTFKDKITMNDSGNGELIINGNHSTSFTINVSAKNGTGYGINIPVYIHQFDKTIAQYGDVLNRDKGAGFASGETISLFNNNQTTTDYSYAFTTAREGYIKNVDSSGKTQISGSKKYSVFEGDKVGVKYQVLIHDYSITEVENEGCWNGEKAPSETPITSGTATSSIPLPAVKMSTTGERVYQIVTIRLTITYNNDPQYYFAHYWVYNPESLEVNSNYSEKVVKYGSDSDAWNSSDAKTLTLIGDSGLYLAPEDADIVTNYSNYAVYVYKLANDGKWEETEWNEDTSFTKTGDNVSITLSNASSANLFTNEGLVKFVIKEKVPTTFYKLEKVTDTYSPDKYYDINGTLLTASSYSGTYYKAISVSGVDFEPNKYYKKAGDNYRLITTLATVLDDIWTLKADSTITPKQEIRLDKFFLQSEIRNANYYDDKIIGIVASVYNSDGTINKDALKFVNNGTASSVDKVSEVLPSDCGYSLYNVTYNKTVTGIDVFTVEDSFLVLVGNANAMSFNTTEDYINLTIDDTNVDTGINLANYIYIYSYNSGSTDPDKYFTYTNPKSISLQYKNANGEFVSDDNNVTLGGTTIKLNNIGTREDNYSVIVKITAGGVVREIELYFNIVLNVKELDTNGYMPYNSMVAEAFANNGELTSDYINNNIILKTELLNMITFSDMDINTSDYNTLSRYTISVTQQTDHYAITYVYNSGSTTYTRTLKMALPTT